MIDLAKQLILQHFILLFVTAVLLFLLLLAILAFFYRKFSGTTAEAEAARRGLELDLSLLGKLGRLFRRKTDVVIARSDSELTISRPIPAVPDPRRSGEAKP